MATWADLQRDGITTAIERLAARSDLPDLLQRLDTWLEAIGGPDEPDRAAVAAHPSTKTLAAVFEAADLEDVAEYLRSFTVVTGPIRPGVWTLAQLHGRASAHRFTAGLIGARQNKPRFFGLESYGAADAFRAEAADILRRDPAAKAAAIAEVSRQVAEVRQNPGKFAIFAPERAGVEEAVRDYQAKPAIKEAWETRLDSHVRFGSTLLTILLRVDSTEFLRHVEVLPHPVFAEQVLPDAAHLSQDELLALTRDAPAAFDAVGVYRAVGMTAVHLLHRASAMIRLTAWGEHGAVPVPREEPDRLDPARIETERVIAQYLDVLFTRTDATYLAWAWLERLIYEGDRRGYWRIDHRRGDGIALDPLIMLVVALARRLEPRSDFETWVRANPPLWRIERAMAGLAVRAFAQQPDRSASRGILEWTLVTLAPTFAGSADAILNANGVVGRIGAYGLLSLDQPGEQLLRLWQKLRPLREQGWRTSASDDDHHHVAQVLILWGLEAVAAAPPEMRQPLWSAFDAVLRDAAQTDRLTFHDEFWPNVLQRYGQIVSRLLFDTETPVQRLAQAVRSHVQPDRAFVQFVLTFLRAGGDRSHLQAAVTEIGADLPRVIQQFLDHEKLRLKQDFHNRAWIEEVTALSASLGGAA